MRVTRSIFFDGGAKRLGSQSRGIFLTEGHLHTFVHFLRTPSRAIDCPIFYGSILKQPLDRSRSARRGERRGQTVGGSVARAVVQLERSLAAFPRLSVRGTSNLSCHLGVKAIQRDGVKLRSAHDESYKSWPKHSSGFNVFLPFSKRPRRGFPKL